MASELEGDAYAMDRYSRQIGAYGVEAMAKLIKMRVLIVNVRGVGMEVAKNLALAGPGAITIADDAVVAVQDLGSNFFLREEHVGTTTRGQASLTELQALNRLVDIKAHSGAVTKELVKAHTAMVLCGASREEALQWDDYCRKHNVGFFMTGVHGLMGYAFVDLGDTFTIRDRNGEQPVSRILDGIDVEGGSASNEFIAHLIPPPDGKRHNIEEDEHEGWVDFDEVAGALGELLNGKGPFRVKHVKNKRTDAKTGKTKEVFDAYALAVTVEGVTSLPPFQPGTGGILNQVKVPEQVQFRSLEANVQQPVAPGDYGLMFTDGAKFGRAEQLHAALQGLWDFQAGNGGKLPTPNDAGDADAVLRCAVKRNEELLDQAKAAMDAEDGAHPAVLALEELDDAVVRMVATHAACEFQPMSTFLGGVVAQEVVKMTGKFTPLLQWLHVDCFEVLPEVMVDAKAEGAVASVSAADRAPRGTRYDDLIMILGKPLHDALMRKKTFMVGCGALGCELLKNFALLGVGCAGDGLVTVTDNDTIEVSNLSRQFLFREHNVGQSKSKAATAAAIDMNRALQVKALETLVAPHTENVFNNGFWEAQDFVTNALDNVEARMYVDGKCVFFCKPLLESGTLGTKCNVQVILPNLTQSYADGPKDDDSANAIPMCTLRNFPSEIEHCIEWARARFTDLFFTAATEASNFSNDPKDWLKELKAKTLELDNRAKLNSAVANELTPLRDMLAVLKHARSPDNCFAECVKEAFALFHSLFRDPIVSLVRTYPENAVDKNGDLFWQGTKRFPSVPVFDAADDMHMGFVISVANLLAVNYGLQPPDQPLPADHPWRSAAHVAKMVGKLPVPPIVVEKVDMSGGGEDDAGGEDGDKAGGAKDGKAMDVDEDAAINEFKALVAELEAMAAQGDAGVTVEPAEFEKDADWNFHIDFCAAASNLRAWNYRLKPVTRHKAKMIAGKIIPAIATTTASVTGLVMIEILKSCQPGKQLEAFKDSSNSLGINGYFFSEPSPPEKAKDEYDPIEMAEVKCSPAGYTKWDKTVIKAGPLKLSQFIEQFKKVTGFNITSVNHESANREGSKGYSKFAYERDAWQKDMKKVYAEALDQQLEQLIFDVYGEDAVAEGAAYVRLEVSCEDDDGNVWKVPTIVYYFA